MKLYPGTSNMTLLGMNRPFFRSWFGVLESDSWLLIGHGGHQSSFRSDSPVSSFEPDAYLSSSLRLFLSQTFCVWVLSMNKWAWTKQINSCINKLFSSRRKTSDLIKNIKWTCQMNIGNLLGQQRNLRKTWKHWLQSSAKSTTLKNTLISDILLIEIILCCYGQTSTNLCLVSIAASQQTCLVAFKWTFTDNWESLRPQERSGCALTIGLQCEHIRREL